MHGAGNRIKMRLACEVDVHGRHHSGLVLNVSPGGLFIQTNAKPSSGAQISVAVNVPRVTSGLSLRAAVVWKRVVPAHLLTVAQGGIGLRLLNPPEDYYQFLAETLESRRPGSTAAAPRPKITPPKSAAEAAALCDCAGDELVAYRVRVRRGQRSRTLTVTANSESAAYEAVLSEVGEGWSIVGSEPKRRGNSTPL